MKIVMADNAFCFSIASNGDGDVVLEIEEAVGIRLGEEDLTEEVLATVGSFVAHVERRRAAVRP